MVKVLTPAIGKRLPGFAPAPNRTQPGDAVIVSGLIGQHGITVMSAREVLVFDTELVSDSADLTPLVERLWDRVGSPVHTLRDPTRGGLASALNEIATAAGVGIELDEAVLPVPAPVTAACEMLGFDPLYFANEVTRQTRR